MPTMPTTEQRIDKAEARTDTATSVLIDGQREWTEQVALADADDAERLLEIAALLVRLRDELRSLRGEIAQLAEEAAALKRGDS